MIPTSLEESSGTSSVLPLALDTMGGDLGPRVQVEGAIRAFKDKSVKSILVGPENELRDIVSGFGASDLGFRIEHAPDVIEMSAAPAKAVRRKPNSSLCVAYNLVIEGKASGILSSGNSGAMMAAGRMICGLLPGIERPAIATLIPTYGDGHPNVVIDSGANVDCHANHLVHFAVMGAIYHSSLFGKVRPRVALLSNGSEPSKGTDMIRSASMILSEMEGVNYVGYVEGRDVTSNKTDVVVCDGFVGNVLLKGMEGCVTLIYKQMLHEARSSIVSRIGFFLAKKALKAVFRGKFDHSAHGGAPLLGLKELAMVLHGSSEARAVESALLLSDSFVKSGMTRKITSAMSALEEQLVDLDGSFVSGMFASGDAMARNGNGLSVKSRASRKVADHEKNSEEEVADIVSQDSEELEREHAKSGLE
ncbi:MAG TPA: phosphate acyltransferase PlsX [Oligoflexia bacterium]|nr:phosphate acyltransferase PlsX [Oligoflexia bacterium]HMP47253.1 phosphate acyltransferase PlsX [Oligoflexia bacterium]